MWWFSIKYWSGFSSALTWGWFGNAGVDLHMSLLGFSGFQLKKFKLFWRQRSSSHFLQNDFISAVLPESILKRLMTWHLGHSVSFIFIVQIVISTVFSFIQNSPLTSHQLKEQLFDIRRIITADKSSESPRLMKAADSKWSLRTKIKKCFIPAAHIYCTAHRSTSTQFCKFKFELEDWCSVS